MHYFVRISSADGNSDFWITLSMTFYDALLLQSVFEEIGCLCLRRFILASLDCVKPVSVGLH